MPMIPFNTWAHIQGWTTYGGEYSIQTAGIIFNTNELEIERRLTTGELPSLRREDVQRMWEGQL